MKIYTSYFAKLPKLPDDIVPISIARFKPKWIDSILEIQAVSPSIELLNHYKEYNDLEYYKKEYQKVLDILDVEQFVRMLKVMSKRKDVALLCYEKLSDFCHRHLLAEHLNKFGYGVQEYQYV